MEKVAKFEFISEQQLEKDFQYSITEIKKNLKLPQRATKNSAGYDFFAPFGFELKPKESILIPTGIKVKINANYFLMLVVRSSYGFKYQVQLDNTIGIIDADYYNNESNEGHIFVKLTNNSLDKTLKVNPLDAFVQGIFLKYGITCDDNTVAERVGGLGSTTQKEDKN